MQTSSSLSKTIFFNAIYHIYKKANFFCLNELLFGL